MSFVCRVDSDEEEEAEFKEKLHQWKKVGAGRQKVKYVYKTADQVLEEGKWRKVSKGDPTVAATGASSSSSSAATASKVKVIDMTGKEERVLSGYHAIAAAKQRPDEDDVAADPVRRDRRQNFEIPELLHNINMLMDNCEEELISADRSLKHHKNKVEVLAIEEEKLANLVDKEKEQVGDENNPHIL